MIELMIRAFLGDFLFIVVVMPTIFLTVVGILLLMFSKLTKLSE